MDTTPHWTVYAATFAAITGVIIACFWNWINHRAENKNRRLNARPFVVLGRFTEGIELGVRFIFYAENQGSGSAIIRGLHFFLDGNYRDGREQKDEMIKQIIKESLSSTEYRELSTYEIELRTWPAIGGYLRPGERCIFMSILFPYKAGISAKGSEWAESEIREALINEPTRLKCYIDYESIYNEKFYEPEKNKRKLRIPELT